MDHLDRRTLPVAMRTCLGIALALTLAWGCSRSAAVRPQHPAPLVPGLEQRHPLDERQVGQLLLAELRCAACHVDSPVEALPPPAAPRLHDVGARVAPEYLRRFLADPAAAEPRTTMPDLLSGESTENRREVAAALTAFLVSRSSQPFARDPIEAQDVVQGRELFHTIGCIACHVPLDQEAAPGDGVSLAQVPLKYSLGSLAGFLFQPLEVRPSGRMPDMNLTRDEARALASYLIGTEAAPAASPVATGALVEAGRGYFDQYRCAACHELEGVSVPAPSAPLDRRAGTHGCLSTVPDGAPDYHLSEAQTTAIRRALAEPSPAATDETQVAATLTAFHCIACHARNDYGGVSAAKDEYFQTTQPDLGKEARIPPHLTGTGSKLRLEWMQKVLFDAATIRPYLITRMPQFGEENLAHLPELLARADRKDPVTIPEPQGDARNIARSAGTLLLGDQGLACITCHDFNGKPSPRFQGLDLIGSFERLRPGWFITYLLSPQTYEPGTVMPSFWSEHEPTLPGVLDGDTQAQIEALWFVLSLGTSAPDPSGIHSVTSRLPVTETPRLYRGRSGIAGYRGIAVGFPGGLNYALNAETGALCGLWRGDFVQVHWGGQGAGDFQPGSRAVSLARDLAFARLDDDQAPWPLLPTLDPDEPVNTDPLYPGNHGYRFRGYCFDEAWVPTFLYRSGDIDIEDRSVADLAGERPRLRRTLHLSAPTAQTLYVRVLTGDIQPVSDQVFQTADLRVTVPDAPTLLRPHSADPSTFELLLKLRVPEGESEVRIDHELLR